MKQKNNIPMQKARAKILFLRFLDDVFLRSLLFFFEHYLSKQTASASLIAFSREAIIYLPQDFNPEAISFIFSILLVHACYTATAMTTSFLCGSYGHP